MEKLGKKLLAGSFIVLLPLLAQAQVEEITVSAQRRDANLQEVPISVSAFTTDDISKLQIDVAADLSAAVPNMQMYDITANAAAMQVFMRGTGIQNPGFNASESPVGLYEDDIYRGRLATANIDLTDIERIEVLRGPQGTLYGRNTIAGAVKFITRTPGDEFWGNASVGYGEFETSKITASVGGPLISGKLAGSLAGLYHNRDEGWIDRGVDTLGDSIPGDPLGEYENKAIRGKLHWYAGDIFEATLGLGYVDAKNDGYNGISYDGNPGAPRQGFYTTTVTENGAGFGKTEQLNASLNLSWDFDGLMLRSITGYSDIDDDFGFDLFAGTVPNFAPPPDVFTGVDGLLVNSSSNNKTISQEFNLSGISFNDKLNWIAGVFYMNEDGQQYYNPSFFGDAIFEDVSTETDSYAVYAEGTWSFTDRLALTLGGRWTRDEKSYLNNCVDNGGMFPACVDLNDIPGGWTLDLEEDFDEFTPRIILEYQWLDNLMIFGSASQGFQAGGFQTLCFGNESCNSLIYDPQTVTSWETGLKTDLMDKKLRVNASIFYAQYEDIQQTAIIGGAFPLINAGDVDVYGFELETYWTPLDGLDLFLIYGFANEDFDSATTVLLQTERLPGLPKSAARFGFDYQVPTFADWAFVIGADANYSDSYLAALTADPDDQLTIDSYNRLNGRIGMMQPDGSWSVMLTGKNLTDSEDNFSGIVGNGTNIRVPQRPREYMLTLAYKYQ